MYGWATTTGGACGGRVDEGGAERPGEGGWCVAVENAIDSASAWLKQLVDQKHRGQQHLQQQQYAQGGSLGLAEQLFVHMLQISWAPSFLRMAQ